MIKRFYVALSGGMDSVVLLHQLANNPAYQNKLEAIHVNHALSPHANDWEAFCAQLCQSWNIPFLAFQITVKPEVGESLEAVARTQRYAIFKGLLQADEALLTAHHQDDQAETVLLQLIRGAGVKGLSAMPAEKSLGQGVLMRPLLKKSHEDILQYALEHNLKWIEDESNQNCDFSRNFLRHKIIPLLKERWPSVAKTLSRSAEHCAEADELFNEIAKLDYKTCALPENRLSITALKTLSFPRQKQVLRHWIASAGHHYPSTQFIQTLLDDVVNAASDAHPVLHLKTLNVRRSKNELYLTA
jgi:tRNA(Ile)-lysidine synthase